MEKEIIGYLRLLVKGGEAKPGPPIAPALGSKGLPIMDFCKQFNAITENRQGKLLRVLITIYHDKTFSFIVQSPPTFACIKEEAGITKGSKEPNRNKVGILTKEAVEKIALIKMDDLNTVRLASAMKMIEGTARSMGITVPK